MAPTLQAKGWGFFLLEFYRNRDSNSETKKTKSPEFLLPRVVLWASPSFNLLGQFASVPNSSRGGTCSQVKFTNQTLSRHPLTPRSTQRPYSLRGLGLSLLMSGPDYPQNRISAVFLALAESMTCAEATLTLSR